MNVNHSVFCCQYHCPSPSPCCGVAGAGVTFHPEAPALGRYWKYPSTKPDAFPHWCAELSALLRRGRAWLSQTLHTGNCAEFIVFALKILLDLFYLIGKFCCPLFCNYSLAKTHLTIKVLFILYSISDPEFESELGLELELIRSLESEQPTMTLHPLVSWYLLSICPCIMPLRMWLSWAQAVGMPMGRHTVIHMLIYFNNINNFHIMFTHTWRRSPRQTKKNALTLTLMRTLCHIRDKILVR